MTHKLLRAALVASLIVLAAGPSALAIAGKGKRSQVHFVGGHPVPKATGGGFCFIEAPHVHVYDPEVKVQYRDHDGAFHFVGDPVAHGWDGPRHAYVGHHPVDVSVVVGDDDHDDHDVEFCYLDGPHYHAFAPPPATEFVLEADAYWYVGAPVPAYLEARAELVTINAVYKPMRYQRPVVVMTAAPPQWIGAHVDVVVAPRAEVVVAPPPRAHVHGAVGFHAGVEVVAPSLSIEVGLPSVHIGGAAHHDVIIVDDHRHGRHKHKGKHKHRRGNGNGRGRQASWGR